MQRVPTYPHASAAMGITAHCPISSPRRSTRPTGCTVLCCPVFVRSTMSLVPFPNAPGRQQYHISLGPVCELGTYCLSRPTSKLESHGKHDFEPHLRSPGATCWSHLNMIGHFLRSQWSALSPTPSECRLTTSSPCIQSSMGNERPISCPLTGETMHSPVG